MVARWIVFASVGLWCICLSPNVFSESNHVVVHAFIFHVEKEQSTRSRARSRMNYAGRFMPISSVVEAREALLSLLRDGETERSPAVKAHIATLQQSYSESNMDSRYYAQGNESISLCGDWVFATKFPPEFPGRLAVTDGGHPIYSIGRLTFSRIKSTLAGNIPCVVTQMTQSIHPLPSEEDWPAMTDIPNELHEYYVSHRDSLRSIAIDTLFRIHNTTLKGILRTKGFALPSATDENRWNMWFVSGLVLPHIDDDQAFDREAWEHMFGKMSSINLSYALPIMNVAYHTVVYLDDVFRIGIGNLGTVVFLVKEQRNVSEHTLH